MKHSCRRVSAFTVLEVVVALVVFVGLLLVLASWGNSDRNLERARMTETLANARTLCQATQMLTLDTKAGGGDGVNWTSVKSKGGVEKPLSLSTYLGLLVKEGYVTKQELRKVLSAPGKKPDVEELRAEDISFKIFWVEDSSPSDQPFVVTANVNPGEGMQKKSEPYGTRGFVVLHKTGDGGVFTHSGDASSPKLFPTGNGGTGAVPYRYVTLK